jgi:hypothetical protein
LSLGLPLSLVAQGVDAARKRVVPELGSSQSSQYPDQGLEFGADGLQGVRDAPEALLQFLASTSSLRSLTTSDTALWLTSSP